MRPQRPTALLARLLTTKSWSAGVCTDHDILKHFIQAVVLLYGAQGFGFEAWEGHETEQTLLLGATYGELEDALPSC